MELAIAQNVGPRMESQFQCGLLDRASAPDRG